LIEAQDHVNAGVWSETTEADWLANLQGFTSEGERCAFFALIDEIRNQPILDLGVGAGRTVPFLRALTADYTAIDFVPAMVELARKRYGGIDVQVGDARDLSRFSDERFTMVNFSYMGIDSVDHEGRRDVLREALRVLRRGGVFWFSTLNQDGPAARLRPWRPQWSNRKTQSGRLMDNLRVLRGIPTNLINYFRVNDLRIDGEAWSVAPFHPHSFRLLAHYITLAYQLDELAAVGFAANPIVFSDDGRRVTSKDNLTVVESFNILARKDAGPLGGNS
jgi:SAM-dependent methyltransferase